MAVRYNAIGQNPFMRETIRMATFISTIKFTQQGIKAINRDHEAGVGYKGGWQENGHQGH